MAKARDAFRTISEVSDWLDTPAHVLRFWESKFAQVKPVKRAGGRRYYRPDDMQLLGGIKILLHEQGMTIKGAQKLLREQGIKNVMALADDPTAPAKPTKVDTAASDPAPAPEVKSAMPPPAVAPTQADAPPAKPAATVTAMPPPTPVAASATPVPETTRPEPTLPREPKMPPEPRIFAALRDADDARLRARAAQIAPLVARLQDVRDRMRQS